MSILTISFQGSGLDKSRKYKNFLVNSNLKYVDNNFFFCRINKYLIGLRLLKLEKNLQILIRFKNQYNFLIKYLLNLPS